VRDLETSTKLETRTQDAIKSFLIQSKPQKESQVSTVGQFILYAAANYYLTTELDQCTKVCEFLYEDIEVADQELFKGNILRFKALALEKDAR